MNTAAESRITRLESEIERLRSDVNRLESRPSFTEDFVYPLMWVVTCGFAGIAIAKIVMRLLGVQ
jgi:hypothetical protein